METNINTNVEGKEIQIALRSKKAKQIIKTLKNKEMTSGQLAKKIKTSVSYTLLLLYRLEALGYVERKRWEGGWVWGLKSAGSVGQK